MKKFFYSHSLFFLAMAIFYSCKEEKDHLVKDELFQLYVPKSLSSPLDSITQLTKYKVLIGKRMFFDKNLSSSKEISCASCHIPSYAFSDTIPISNGVLNRKGLRNAPTIVNATYKPHFFMDGGSPTLEMQVVGPIEDENEMNMNYLEAIAYLKNDSQYNKWSQIAYSKEPDAFVFTRSIAAYQRTLLSGDSKYDLVQKKHATFTTSEKRGYDLFISDKTKCSSCHSGGFFTDNTFHNIGLPYSKLDSGRMRVTLKEIDRNKFVTPTLRNIALTAPYMHDGSIATLYDVITFFNKGGASQPNKNEWIKPLKLSKQEKEDIINFLNTLTDYNFIKRHEKDSNI